MTDNIQIVDKKINVTGGKLEIHTPSHTIDCEDGNIAIKCKTKFNVKSDVSISMEAGGYIKIISSDTIGLDGAGKKVGITPGNMIFSAPNEVCFEATNIDFKGTDVVLCNAGAVMAASKDGIIVDGKGQFSADGLIEFKPSGAIVHKGGKVSFP